MQIIDYVFINSLINEHTVCQQCMAPSKIKFYLIGQRVGKKKPHHKTLQD